jgi:NAD(P)H dehydrogenase (quinone)
MHIFIVHAHHEPTSFNSAMTHEALATLTSVGHEVIISDLYAMNFDPVSDRRNFVTVADSEKLNQQTEEAHASAHQGYMPDLQAEMDKLAGCDLLIFQFPIWWLGLPAILKGWVDRVFAVGRAYGGGRWFDNGMFVGKRAMCSITVGGPAPVYTDMGIYGSIESILYPIHRGIFGFTGFTVIEPFVVYAPKHISHEERLEYLAQYRNRLLNIDTAPIITNPNTNDYEGFARKSAKAQ